MKCKNMIRKTFKKAIEYYQKQANLLCIIQTNSSKTFLVSYHVTLQLSYWNVHLAYLFIKKKIIDRTFDSYIES